MRFAQFNRLKNSVSVAINKNVKSLVNTLIATAIVASLPVKTAAASTLVVLSNDLSVCSSENQRYCSDSAKESFSDDVKQKAIFDITDEALIRVNDYAWTEQLELQQQVLSLLNRVKPKFENKPLTERQFVRALRGLTIEADGEQIAGRDIWQSMYEFEKRNLFDLLEQKQNESRSKRLRTQVNFEQSTNIEARLAYQKLYELSKQIAGPKRNPRIAVITGANRDPYGKVDYYLNLFQQVGFDATWLPVDAAMQTAITAKQYEKSACDSLEDFQVKRLSSFRRKVLYPDLYRQQLAECKKSEPLISTIKRMDAIYIADGSPLLNYHALYTPTGERSAALNKITDMFEKGEALVAIEGRSVNAVTSNKKPISILAGAVNEINTLEPVSFNSGFDACNLGADCIAIESERDFTVIESEILPFLPDAVIDTEVSKRGKQLRAIHAALFSGNNRVFGLDGKTAAVFKQSEKQTDIEIVGSGGMWLFEITAKNNDAGVRDFTSHYFTHGDKIAMRSNSISVEFPSWKYSTQLSDSQPNVTSAQVFARNNFFKLNEMMCKTGAKSATGNDAINEQQVNLSISQTASAHARLGVVKESDGEFQVCSLSQVNNNLAVSNRL